LSAHTYHRHTLAAQGTFFWHKDFRPAIVTHCRAVLKVFTRYSLYPLTRRHFGFMKGKSDITVPATDRMFAGRAEYEVAVAAPIEQQDGLFLSQQDLRKMFSELPGYQFDALLYRKILPQVNQFHLRHRQVHNPFGQSHEREMFFPGAVVEGFERRRS
jgi:hypothetical protein